MRRAILTVILLLALAGTAAAVDLFPTVNVTTQQREAFYKSVAHVTGYTEGTAEAPVTDPALWTDQAAIAAHVRQVMIQQAKDIYRASQAKQAREALPPESSYDLGVE